MGRIPRSIYLSLLFLPISWVGMYHYRGDKKTAGEAIISASPFAPLRWGCSRNTLQATPCSFSEKYNSRLMFALQIRFSICSILTFGGQS